MKVQFDIKYRPQIESGEYKVETRDGRAVCITCWDAEAINPKEFKGIKILAYHTNSESKLQFGYNENGKFSGFPPEDLFIVTPDPELTEFEQSVRDCIIENLTTHGREMSSTVFIDDDAAKKLASELFGLARTQLQIEGLVTMEHLNIACEAEYQSGLADGKNEALKDLPRWKVSNAMRSTLPIIMYGDNGMILYKDGFEISISDLEKLPKED